MFRQQLLTQASAISGGGYKEGLSKKLAQRENLSELKCAEWWYQWLSQALLIKAERSVVLTRFTRVSTRDHYE